MASSIQRVLKICTAMSNLTQYVVGRVTSNRCPVILKCTPCDKGWSTSIISGEAQGMGNLYVSNESFENLCSWFNHDFLGRYMVTDDIDDARRAYDKLEQKHHVTSA